ncbi:transglutaminase family protein [Azorhizobium sp. AG788]|uniref:transglutaminase family protein n=1 Tax=Azorhizobium sp. AG788 TaxID=2183897 RepID=UPI00313911A1
MRVRVRHEIIHRFEPMARHAIATLRLTPRSHVGQHVVRWSLDVTPDCRLIADEDAFGNIVHTLSVEGAIDAITVIAEGDVDTQDTTGIAAGTAERFPPSLFLRQTPLTACDDALNALAAEIAATSEDPLTRLHALMVAVHKRVEEVPADAKLIAQPGAKALATAKGCSAELAHVFIAVARALRIPARQVSGYAALEGVPAGLREWAEAHVPTIGWVAFDCGENLCATDAHVRLAVGLDSLAVSPMLSTGISAQNAAVASDFFQTALPGQGQQQSQGQRQQ